MTQRDRLRELFKSRKGEWVSLNEILDMRIGQYNSRIFDLRRNGMDIQNRTQMVDGVVHSWYGYEIKEKQKEFDLK